MASDVLDVAKLSARAPVRKHNFCSEDSPCAAVPGKVSYRCKLPTVPIIVEI